MVTVAKRQNAFCTMAVKGLICTKLHIVFVFMCVVLEKVGEQIMNIHYLDKLKASSSKAVFTLGRGLGPGAGPHVYTYILRTRVFQDPGPMGTVFLTVPADLGPGPDQLNQRLSTRGYLQ